MTEQEAGDLEAQNETLPKVRLGEPFSTSFRREQIGGHGRLRTCFALEGIGTVSIDYYRSDSYEDLDASSRATPAGPAEIKKILRTGKEVEIVSLPFDFVFMYVECDIPEKAEKLRVKFICNGDTWEGESGDGPALKQGILTIYEWSKAGEDNRYTCFFPDDLQVLNNLNFTISNS